MVLVLVLVVSRIVAIRIGVAGITIVIVVVVVSKVAASKHRLHLLHHEGVHHISKWILLLLVV